MGDWKAPLSVKVRRVFREELETEAGRIRQTLSGFAELLLERGFEEYQRARSFEAFLAGSPSSTDNKAGVRKRLAEKSRRSKRHVGEDRQRREEAG